MKWTCLFILLFINQNFYSQEKYFFDYYSAYKYQKKETDSKSKNEITFSNSKNTDYYLTATINENIISNIQLVDHKNKKMYMFDDFNLNETNKDVVFKNSKSYNLLYNSCKKSSEIIYKIEDANASEKHLFSIKQFKNTSKLPFLREVFFETKSSDTFKNQHYNVPGLIIPLWCGKFQLNNEEVITKYYFLENNKIINIRELVEIKNNEFSITIQNTTENKLNEKVH